MLIDEIIEWARAPHKKPDMFKFTEKIADSFVVKAQNVANYLFETSERDVWDFERDFPNVAPPAPAMWFEWRQPRLCNIAGKFKEIPYAGFEFGALILAYDLTKGPLDIEGITIPPLSSELIKRMRVRWLCMGHLYGRTQDRGLDWLGMLAWYVRDDGSIYRPQGKWLVSFDATRVPVSKQQAALEFLAVAFYVPFLSMTFMHCRNVEIVASSPWATALQKSRKKRGKQPLVRWHTLVIEPIKKILSAANDGNSSLTPKALHICRGHFKNFTERGLFGKYHGVYWWPMSARGSSANGEVRKDYLVKAP